MRVTSLAALGSEDHTGIYAEKLRTLAHLFTQRLKETVMKSFLCSNVFAVYVTPCYSRSNKASSCAAFVNQY